MSIANPYLHEHNVAAIGDVKLRRRACYASLSVALILIVTKLVAYIVTDSVTMMSSLMDSGFDAVASAITLLGVIHAATPADEEHRFGHGKIESLAALGQAVFIVSSAGYLLFESAHRFAHPQPVKDVSVGIAVMVLSIVLTLFLVQFQRHVIQKTQSVAVSADNLHYKGDLLMNISVLAALALNHVSDWLYFDPLFASVIALIMLKGAWGISRSSFGILLDQELPDADRRRIKDIVLSHPQVRAVHDLRTRDSGQRCFIEFHMEVDGDMTLKKAHDITEEVEMLIYRAFPTAEALIHPEPAGLVDHRIDDKVEKPA